MLRPISNFLVMFFALTSTTSLFAIGTDISCENKFGSHATVIGHFMGRALLCQDESFTGSNCVQPISLNGRIAIRASENGFCDYVGDKISFIHLGNGLYNVTGTTEAGEQIANSLMCKRIDPIGEC